MNYFGHDNRLVKIRYCDSVYVINHMQDDMELNEPL